VNKNMGLSRRQFLKASTLIGSGLFLPLQWNTARAAAPVRLQSPTRTALNPTTLTKYVDPLPLPPRWMAGQLRTRGLTMAESTHQFHSQLGATRTWGYGGASYLGPTIEVVGGTPLSFTARNHLGSHILGIDKTLHGPDMANDERASHPATITSTTMPTTSRAAPSGTTITPSASPG
jgi:spore coat protein A, manganese oxidase